MIDYKQFFLSTTRIAANFIEDIGNPISGVGTGFWLSYKDRGVFITNRHMVDVARFDPKYKNHNLDRLHIWLRTELSIDFAPIKFEVDLSKTNILLHDTADVAALVNITALDKSKTLITHSINVKDRLADYQFISERLNLVDRCAFIGYPGNIGGNEFWDEASGLPIVRGAEISSYPPDDFVHKSINTSHARLVSGLSFAGSSGSPILNLGTPLSSGSGITIHGAVEPMIIGIMAGHWWNDNSLPEFVKKHTGLSYFVASTAIYELLEKVKF